MVHRFFWSSASRWVVPCAVMLISMLIYDDIGLLQCTDQLHGVTMWRSCVRYHANNSTAFQKQIRFGVQEDKIAPCHAY
ncbi:hypothetical protein SERLADRAFT_470038 [Serpula lacrymans var. lacrymans S7.9]|uniref:Uncharacterized protein n=1 Tax=Serpula lacrymans var. lacrymans (strain S7.9) TaxID=578457 RepID=F8NYS1_SERL9|nr:uncharacterized protein SERLADRAFT_470038 [Serpula lacrymans var. lacrymans S7.9]EGO23742.1 hypothetical protein SERLADRAFT_470038 [Serpula lacrymans var. lacrymans S7.9]